MALEQFVNNAVTTLTGSVNNITDPVVLTVASAALFPVVGNFRLLIDNEVLLCTAVTGTSFTCNRAQESSSIAAHSNGTSVECPLTRGSLFQLLADMNQYGIFSSRPTAGVPGRKYYCSDTPFWYYDDGSVWHKFFGTYPIITPDNTGFSWDNQGGATLSTTKDMLTILAGTITNGAWRYKTAPSTPYTVTAVFLANFSPSATLDYYLGFRESSSGKITSIGLRHSSTVNANSWKWTTASNFLGNYLNDNTPVLSNGITFLRIEDDGTNRNIYFSTDGINFARYHQVGNTDFLTADQIAWGMYSDTPTGSVSLIHWQ